MPKKSVQKHTQEYFSYEEEFEKKGAELGKKVDDWLENFILIPIGMIFFLSLLIAIIKWITSL